MIQLLPIFFVALAHCETRGEKNPDIAIGSDGMSVGRYQLVSVYVMDVNRILRLQGHPEKQYQLEDRTDPAKAEEMIRIYLGYYGPLKEKAFGRELEPWELALIHHYGPTAWTRVKSADSDAYSRRFQARYDRGL